MIPAGYRFRPMRRVALPRSRTLLGPDFPGGGFPIGSPVSFGHRGRTYRGEVTGLQQGAATVVDADRCIWEVPYSLLRRDANAPEPRCSLEEVARLGGELIRRHTETGGLTPGWEFGFNLDRARAGVCRFEERRIEVSVSFCHRAGPEKVEKTILHEIAHAIVGLEHNHDAVWNEINLRIGGDPGSCHDVDHTPPRWVGRCGCGNRWQRHRLARGLRRAICTKCRGAIRWERHVGGFLGNGSDAAATPAES